MILVVSGATRTVARYPEVGHMVSPRTGNSLVRIAASGRPWCADNDAFGAWDTERFWRMLGQISRVDRSRFLWVVCPDVVADAQATVNRWVEWYPQIKALDLPAAFVGQDGLEAIPDQIPWEEMAGFFIGGSTAWKLSQAAEELAREAKRRGKWVHVGRVNTKKRIQHAYEIGADSIDGTTFSRWPDRYLRSGLTWMASAAAPTLFSTAAPGPTSSSTPRSATSAP